MKIKIYQWLKGDGNAFFDTNYIPQIGDEFSWHCVFPNDAQKFERMFAVEEIGYTNFFGLYWSGSNIPAFSYTSSAGGPYLPKYYNTLDIEDSAIVQHQGNRTLWVFAGNDWRNNIPTYNGVTAGKIAYLQIKDKLHLVPCLTETNEACMVDLLSGEIYRNQGTGSFSVEGEMIDELEIPMLSRMMRGKPDYVVRLREWLVCNMYQYIAVPKSKNVRLKLSTQGQNSQYGFIYGYNGGLRTYKTDNLWILRGENISTLPFEGEIYIDIENKYVEANGIRKEIPDATIEELNAEQQYLFADDNWGRTFGYIGKCGEVIANNFHLHPCDILYHPTLAPQSAMIDLSTGDLYTNQGTGELRCEGADLGIVSDAMVEIVRKKSELAHIVVEKNGAGGRVIWERKLPWTEHRWLKGDGVALMDAIPLSEYDLKIKPLQTNLNAFSVYKDSGFAYQYSIMTDGSGQLFFNKTGERRTFTPQGIDAIKATADKININGTDIADIDITGIDHIRPFPKNMRGVYLVSKITDTLTPAVLDRPTLAEEDNNNIARKMGEAVLVDEQRYKRGLSWIFGNVAKNANNNPIGKFEVSDYLIENEDYEVISGVVGKGDVTTHTGANIKTGLIVGNNDVIHISFGGVARDFWAYYTNEYQCVCYKSGLNIVFRQYYQLDITLFDKAIYVQSDNVTIDFVNNKLIFDNNVVRDIPMPLSFGVKFNVFTNYWADTQTIKSLSVDGKLNLIPVRLLRTIEPYTTHNGKGGSEGEYCLFDTISGLAFTNDGSGKFKRFFEEGKDYERIAGVKGDGLAYINLNLGQEEYVYCSFSSLNPNAIIFTDNQYSKMFFEDGYLRLFHHSTSNNLYNADIISDGSVIDAKMTIEMNIQPTAVVQQGDKIANTARCYFIRDTIVKFLCGEAVVYSFKNNLCNLIPIRLLKKAYSTDTHNGKEYPAGTICFLNTIDGVIYGNDGETNFTEYIPE